MEEPLKSPCGPLRKPKASELSIDSSASPTAESAVKVAVALGSVQGSMCAPRVLAGGRGAIAEQILNIAFAQGIRVREDPDLAQLLAALDVDSEIPVQAFAAVAEILVYVYRANGAVTATGEITPDGESPDQTHTEQAEGPAG